MSNTSKDPAEDTFPELNIRELKLRAERWVKKFHEAPIKRILLYGFSSPYEGEVAGLVEGSFRSYPHIYAIVFEVDAENRALEMSAEDQMRFDLQKINGERSLESYERLLDATEPNSRKPYEERYRYFISEDFKLVYKRPPKNMDPYRKDWLFRVKFQDSELNANVRTDELFLILFPWNSSGTAKGADMTEAEAFIRELRVSFESDREVKFQQPKRKAVECQSSIFGDTIWRDFIGIIQHPNNTYYVGKPGNSDYSKRQKRLSVMDRRLKKFIQDSFPITMPDKFRLYELCPDEESGTYRFVFQIVNKVDNQLDKERAATMDQIERLSTLLKKIPISEQQKRKELLAQIEPYLKKAAEKKWITPDEARNLIRPPEDIVVDPKEILGEFNA